MIPYAILAEIATNDLLMLGGVVAGAVGLIQGLLMVGDRLWKKDENTPSPTDELLREFIQRLSDQPQIQSQQCGAQHSVIRESVLEQIDAIKEMTKAIHAMQSTMHETLKADELRHQILLRELTLLSRTSDQIVSKLDRIAH
jgi:hypothetical protein